MNDKYTPSQYELQLRHDNDQRLLDWLLAEADLRDAKEFDAAVLSATGVLSLFFCALISSLSWYLLVT